ncbi:MAG: T9SS type A sorting domain-containing protein [Adhaeribacter sp.]
MPGKSFFSFSITRQIPARFFAFLFLLLLLTGAGMLPALGQSPSIIYGKALNGGDKVLDPNLDGFVSVTTAGFTGGDIGVLYSEIPYRFFPQMGLEPLADLVTGAGGGHTDLAERPLGMFFDGAHVLVRVRLGGNSTASKGYSMLIDANNSFNTGSNGLPFLTPSKVINPGFEYEIAFASNFDVKLYRHQGSGDTNDPYSRNVIWTGNMNTYSQRSVAFTTAGGDPDYFYDFYVPLSAFQGGITAATPLRLTGSTVTSAQTGLEGTISDVGGVDDRLFGNDARKIWAQVINSFPPTSLDQLKDGEFGCLKSLAPVLQAPVKQFDTALRGTSAEADGTLIRVYKGGTVTNNVLSGATLLGTGTVSGGSWVISVSGLALNDQIRATAVSQRPLKCESLVSNTVSVTAGDCKISPPVITTTINGNKGVNGTTSITVPHRIYVWLINADGSTSTGPFSTSNYVDFDPATQGSTWSISAAQQGQSFTDGTYVAVAAPHGNISPTISCTSRYSGFYCFAKSGSPAAAAQPTINEAYLLTSSATLTGTGPASATISVYRNDIRTTASATANASGVWTANIASLGLQAGDLVTAVATAASGCPSAPSPSITVYAGVTASPLILGSYCLPGSGSTSLTVTGSATEIGAQIRLYAGGVELSTSPSLVRVSDQGLWSASVPGITAATVLTARAAAAGKVESAASAPAPFRTQSASGTLAFTKSNFSTPINGASTSPVVIDGTTTNYITSGTGADGAVYGTYSFPAGATNTTATIRVYLDRSLLDSVNLVVNPALPASYAWSLQDFSQQELYPGALVTATVSLRATGPGGLSQCESPYRAPSGGNPYEAGASLAAYDYVQCRTVPANPGTFNFTAAALCQYTPLTLTISNSLSSLFYKVYVNGQARSAYVAGNNGTLTITTQALTTAGIRTITVRAATDSFTGGCQAELAVTGSSPAVTSKNLTVNASSLAIPTVTGAISCYNTAATLTLTNSNLHSNGVFQLKKDGVNVAGATVAANATAGLTLTVPASATLSPGTFTVSFNPNSQTGSNCPVESAPIPATIPLLSSSPTTSTPSICANNTVRLFVPTEYGGASPYTYRVYLNTTANLVATLTGDGTTQTVTSPAFTGTAPYTTNAVHNFFVEVTKQGCAAARLSGTATVTVGTAATAPTPANAGADQTLCPPSFSLKGNQPAYGTGRWTITSQPVGSNALFSDNTRYNATVSNLVSGVYIFRWTITASCSGASSFDEVTLTANCPTSYAVSTPDYVNNYKVNEVLASPYDTEGFAASGTSFTLLSGTLPPGTTLDPVTGQVRLTDLNTFSAMSAYSYSFTTSARDVNNTLTSVPVSMSFYPAASQRSLAALPVTLLFFRGAEQASGVNLQWATATETNNSYFVVERSSDGISFLPLGRVAGAGQSLVQRQYTFLDRQPVSGMAYYRLRQVDLDHTEAFSKTIAVKAAGQEQVRLLAYPNPCPGLLHLELSQGREQVAVEVRDPSGKLWLKRDFLAADKLQLDLQQLPAGLYLVRADWGSGQQQVRVVKP